MNGLSAVTATGTKYCSMMNLENELRVAITKFQPQYDNLCSKRLPHLIKNAYS
jgi:hypothetical protein